MSEYIKHSSFWVMERFWINHENSLKHETTKGKPYFHSKSFLEHKILTGSMNTHIDINDHSNIKIIFPGKQAE